MLFQRYFLFIIHLKLHEVAKQRGLTLKIGYIQKNLFVARSKVRERSEDELQLRVCCKGLLKPRRWFFFFSFLFVGVGIRRNPRTFKSQKK